MWSDFKPLWDRMARYQMQLWSVKDEKEREEIKSKIEAIRETLRRNGEY